MATGLQGLLELANAIAAARHEGGISGRFVTPDQKTSQV
jgi:hypothetical protein